MNEKPTYLQLTDNFRVSRCDDRNLELEEYREVVTRPNRYVKEKTVSKKWISIGYYSNLPQAVNGALQSTENNLTAKTKMTLESIVTELRELSDELKTSVVNSGIKLTDFVKVTDNRGKKASEVKVAKVKDVIKKTTTKKAAKKRTRKTATKS